MNKQLKHYEVLFILKPTLIEEELKERVSALQDLLAKHEAQLVYTQEMGPRKLAYSINKYERGVYFVFYFKALPSFITELERVLRINEDVLRFLLVKYENKRELAAWEAMSQGQKPARREKKQVASEQASAQ